MAQYEDRNENKLLKLPITKKFKNKAYRGYITNKDSNPEQDYILLDEETLSRITKQYLDEVLREEKARTTNEINSSIEMWKNKILKHYNNKLTNVIEDIFSEFVSNNIKNKIKNKLDSELDVDKIEKEIFDKNNENKK